MTSFLYFLLIAVLAAAAVVDICKRIIPDGLSSLCLVVGVGLIGSSQSLSLASGILGGLLCGGILFFASLLTKGAVGMGDAKLFAAAGVGLGIGDSAQALVLASVISGLFGLVLLCINLNNKKKTIPFAPFILISAIMVLLG